MFCVFLTFRALSAVSVTSTLIFGHQLDTIKPMKVSVFKRKRGPYTDWCVNYIPANGKKVRKFFSSRGEADARAEEIKTQHQQAGGEWLALTPAQRNELIQIQQEVIALGTTLRQLVDMYKADGRLKLPQKTVKEAYTDFMTEKERERLAKRSLATLKSNVGRFVKAYGSRQLRSISRADGLEWLKKYDHRPRTFNSNLGRLNTFFRHAVKVGLLTSNPFASIDPVDKRRMPDLDKEPSILSFAQCKALLKATLEHDAKLAPYPALCLFAGLRPEREAGRIKKEDINGEVLVRGLHAKDRQRRHVKIHSTLQKWLDLGGDLPAKNLRKRWENVRLKSGLVKEVDGKLVGWHQDCLRHTFASAWLAMHGADSTIQQLGHGDYDMLFGHYRTLMTKDDAEKIFSLTPDVV